MLALPGVFGLFAAERAPRVLAASLASQGAMAVEGAKVRRGWFRSEIEQRFRLTDGGLAQLLALWVGAETARELIVSARVIHGPFPGAVPALARADALYRIVDGTGAMLDVPAGSRSRVTLAGRIITDIRLEPVTDRCRPARGCLDSAGGHLRLEQAASGTPWALLGDLEPFSLSGADGRVTLAGVAIRASARPTPEGPPSGEGHVRSDHIEVSDPEGHTVTLESAEVASSLDVGGGRLAQTLRLNLPRIVANDGETGAFRIVVGARDLDAATIYRLGRELAETSTEDRPARTATLLADAWEALAVHGPTLFVEELALENGAESATGFLHLGLPPAAARSGQGLFDTLIQDLDGRLEVALSEGIVRTLSEADPDQGHRLAALISLGYLEAQDGVYRMQAAYAGRVLTVNGRPLPLPALPPR